MIKAWLGFPHVEMVIPPKFGTCHREGYAVSDLIANIFLTCQICHYHGTLGFSSESSKDIQATILSAWKWGCNGRQPDEMGLSWQLWLESHGRPWLLFFLVHVLMFTPMLRGMQHPFLWLSQSHNSYSGGISRFLPLVTLEKAANPIGQYTSARKKSSNGFWTDHGHWSGELGLRIKATKKHSERRTADVLLGSNDTWEGFVQAMCKPCVPGNDSHSHRKWQFILSFPKFSHGTLWFSIAMLVSRA